MSRSWASATSISWEMAAQLLLISALVMVVSIIRKNNPLEMLYWLFRLSNSWGWWGLGSTMVWQYFFLRSLEGLTYKSTQLSYWFTKREITILNSIYKILILFRKSTERDTKNTNNKWCGMFIQQIPQITTIIKWRNGNHIYFTIYQTVIFEQVL